MPSRDAGFDALLGVARASIAEGQRTGAPIEEHEYAGLHVHVSILGPREALRPECEDDLVAMLRPGVDGLVLEERGRVATFLPAVWAQLASPREFLAQLRRKAGLPVDHWSETIRFSRYTVRDVEEPARSSSLRSDRTISRS